MNVLVIPEDFRNDQFILRPIISAMFKKLGQSAIIEVLQDPLLGGIDKALNPALLKEIIEANRWKVDLFCYVSIVMRRRAAARLLTDWSST